MLLRGWIIVYIIGPHILNQDFFKSYVLYFEVDSETGWQGSRLS